jgi:hypothetical protein
MSTSQIWFGIRAVDPTGAGPVLGSTAQLALLDDNADFATRTIAGNLVDQGGIQFQQLLAFTGDATQQAGAGVDLSDFEVDGPGTGNVNTGDMVVGSGVVAHNVADMNGNGRLTNTTGIDRSDDPVSIFGHGKLNNGALTGNVTDGWVTFSNDKGFGLINGSGWETTATSQALNDGDSVSFDVAAGKVLKFASFVVRTSSDGGAVVVLDSDGRTIADTNGNTQGGFVQDGSLGELDLGALNDGDLVKIDYELSTVTVNDVLVGGTAAFFLAFMGGGADVLTLGSMVGGGGAWSADDLILTTGLDEPDTAPGLGYLSFDLFGGADPAPGALLDSRLYAYFDADENGTMSVAESADAENLGQMRPGNFDDDPAGDNDDNPVQGAGPVNWVDLYVVGRANTSGFAAPAQAQYGEPEAGNGGSAGLFALSVNTGQNEATITPGGPNGSPLDIDNGPSTFNDSGVETIELGEIVGVVLNAFDGTSAEIRVNVVSDAPTDDADVDMIVRLYQGSTLIETLTYDLVVGVNTVTAVDNFDQAFDRMEIAATGSMAGENVGVDFGAAFVIEDLNIRLADDIIVT